MYQISKLVSVGGTCLPWRWDVLLGRLRFSTKWFACACAVLGIVPLACANGPMVLICPVRGTHRSASYPAGWRRLALQPSQSPCNAGV